MTDRACGRPRGAGQRLFFFLLSSGSATLLPLRKSCVPACGQRRRVTAYWQNATHCGHDVPGSHGAWPFFLHNSTYCLFRAFLSLPAIVAYGQISGRQFDGGSAGTGYLTAVIYPGLGAEGDAP